MNTIGHDLFLDINFWSNYVCVEHLSYGSSRPSRPVSLVDGSMGVVNLFLVIFVVAQISAVFQCLSGCTGFLGDFYCYFRRLAPTPATQLQVYLGRGACVQTVIVLVQSCIFSEICLPYGPDVIQKKRALIINVRKFTLVELFHPIFNLFFLEEKGS